MCLSPLFAEGVVWMQPMCMFRADSKAKQTPLFIARVVEGGAQEGDRVKLHGISLGATQHSSSMAGPAGIFEALNETSLLILVPLLTLQRSKTSPCLKRSPS